MKLTAAFLRLIRWPNLLFIIITQALFYYIIFFQAGGSPGKDHFDFWLLVLASVLIAAAGNIINDYFDEQIDTVNKPDKLVISKFIKRRWAIILHVFFSLAGLGLSLYVSRVMREPVIAIANAATIILLWVYSTHFKKQLLTGNLVISALTAWVIGVVYFFCGGALLQFFTNSFNQPWFFKVTVVYAGFAFITSLIREGVKDMEDIAGDEKYKCRTMPIVWGIPASKVFVAVWAIVCIAALLILMVYTWLAKYYLMSLYIVALIVLPFLGFLQMLKKAITPADFYACSTRIKLIMLSGILSMVLFLFL